MGVSIIGLGAMGQNHLRVLSQLKGINIDYIYDSNINRIKKLSKLYNVKWTKNIKEIKKNSEHIIISSPTISHFNYIKIFKDKNIFVEKPLTNNLEQAVKLKKILNKQLQCGFIERFNSAIPILKDFSKKNKIISMNFIRTDKLSQRIKDVNVILDLMIHDIDLSIYFNGKVKSISAYGFKKAGQISYAKAILYHQNKTISCLEASKITQKKVRNISFTSAEAFIDSNLLTKEILINTQTNLNTGKNNQKIQNKLIINSKQEKVLVSQNEALKAELEFFINKKNKNLGYPNLNESIYNLKIAKKIENEINKKL